MNKRNKCPVKVNKIIYKRKQIQRKENLQQAFNLRKKLFRNYKNIYIQ